MNNDFINESNVRWWGIVLISLGAIKPVCYTSKYNGSNQYDVYMNFWHPLSWFIIFAYSLVCIFIDYNIQEIVNELKKPKDDKWSKVSLWKAN
jgi:hypothetical protein